MHISADDARYAFSYSPITGLFVRKHNTTRSKAGDVTGTLDKSGGYIRIRFKGKFHLAHRLAWLWFYGEHPTIGIDHIDGDKTNNRIANLRLANARLNAENQRAARPKSKSGLLGAHWLKDVSKWRSNIVVNGRHKYLGIFDNQLDAHKAYIEAKRKFHIGGTI